MSSPSSVGSPDTPGDLLAQPNGTHDHPDPDAVDSTHAPPPAAPAAPPPDEFDTAIFPAPPAFYHRYTQRNLALPPDATISDVPGEPRPFSRADLDPPNVDWIIEDGSYAVFGETWPIDEKLPTLEDMGVAEMFDRDADRKTSLQSLLRTLIITYTQLLDALLTPPPSLAHPQPPRSDVERLTEHMRLVAINMHYLVNELRPVQARETLKAMMRAQIDLRRAKTVAIKQKCAEITSTIATLHSDVLAASTAPAVPSPADRALSAADDALDHLAKLRARVDALEEEEP
ncbi:mediator of RNA polymerase II transcription subunit 7 [Rhodotorula diobovata]|uniref:Mediator of RNA polymerase II transcription subunit 7 n=1 Tax=Rhodotorula diobovata TaxID=5288 RepID=A0A5C5FUB7_9BASI|nr:mediator of RNA polymerase II transcription subunit 7 [Rhodotorula diobovata]